MSGRLAKGSKQHRPAQSFASLARAIYRRRTVWVGQISRDIGTKLTTQTRSFTTHRISPEVDQDRYYILQDLLLTGEAYWLAFASGVGVSSPANPRTNLGFDLYVTDGLRVVVFLDPRRKHAGPVEFLDWQRPLRSAVIPVPRYRSSDVRQRARWNSLF
jgi:hypothetical protein